MINNGKNTATQNYMEFGSTMIWIFIGHLVIVLLVIVIVL